jgi:peptidyl-prolyl cis-trans isomerase D
VIVLRAKEHLKPAQLPLESVAGPIREQLTKEHASAAAKTKADELIASLRAGKTPLDKAIDGQNWKVTAGATRAQEGLTQPCCKRCSGCRSLSRKTSRPSVA